MKCYKLTLYFNISFSERVTGSPHIGVGFSGDIQMPLENIIHTWSVGQHHRETSGERNESALPVMRSTLTQFITAIEKVYNTSCAAEAVVWCVSIKAHFCS